MSEQITKHLLYEMFITPHLNEQVLHDFMTPCLMCYAFHSDSLYDNNLWA